MSEKETKKMTVSDILEEISADFCEKLCKYPKEYGLDNYD